MVSGKKSLTTVRWMIFYRGDLDFVFFARFTSTGRRVVRDSCTRRLQREIIIKSSIRGIIKPAKRERGKKKETEK